MSLQNLDIDLNQAAAIALKNCASHFVNWKLIDVAILRCEFVNGHWEVDVRHIYLHGDCIIFPCEISFDGSTISYSQDFVDLPPEFKHLEPVE